MKTVDAEQRVIEIRAHKGDPETWHSMRDELYRDILEAIAGGHRNGRALAHAALVLQHPNEQPRWEAAG